MKQLITTLFLATALAFGGISPVAAAVAAPAAAAVKAPAPVNVNTAAATQLVRLPGIGKTTADRIIAYRTEHGPFKTVDDLVKVKGIGKKTLEKLREMVTVD